jgi:hypothetical protein
MALVLLESVIKFCDKLFVVYFDEKYDSMVPHVDMQIFGSKN